MKKNSKRVLKTLLVVGALSGIAAFGVLSAYVAQTTNASNNITAGNISLTDNDASAAMFPAASFGNVKPSDSPAVKCLQVTYNGSLTAAAKLYLQSAVTNGDSFNMQITKGTGGTATFPACPSSGVTWDSTDLYSGPMSGLATTYAGGYSLGTGLTAGTSAWVRFTMTVNDDPTVGAHTTTKSTGDHTWVAEAQSS
jgi:hypothetical protein